MTTLARAVAIGDNDLIVDAPTGWTFPRWVKIDTELLAVGGQQYREGTTLVLSEPATATHAANATVTDAGRPFDAAFIAATVGEGGGGSLTVDNTVDAPEEVTTIIAPGAVVGGGEATLPDVVTVLKVTVPLTDAQIKALPTTPIELVAAPGAGKTIYMLGAFIRIDTSENGYENVGNLATLLVTFAGEGPGPAQGLLVNTVAPANDAVSDLFGSFTNISILLAPYTTIIPVLETSLEPSQVDVSQITNKALVLAMDNTGDLTGDLTEGDPANTGSITVIYAIVDV